MVRNIASLFAFDAPSELSAWGDVEVFREIAQSNRASRTWEVVLGSRRGVAKLTFDKRFAVEPGIRVARHVQSLTGVLTGQPIPALDGEVVVEVGGFTLALLEFVAGDAIATFDESLATKAGRLLGTVHGALARPDTPAVPAAVLDWYRSFYRDPEVDEIVAAIERTEGLTRGVLYGDPAPEVLRRPNGELALIDWGTPSRGPLMHDLGLWGRHVGSEASHALRAGYFETAPSGPHEVVALELFDGLWSRIAQLG